MEKKDLRKELRGARACRTLGRDVGAVAEMAARGLLTPDEARDLCNRLRRELETHMKRGSLTPHQAEKVLADLADADAVVVGCRSTVECLQPATNQRKITSVQVGRTRTRPDVTT